MQLVVTSWLKDRKLNQKDFKLNTYKLYGKIYFHSKVIVLRLRNLKFQGLF